MSESVRVSLVSKADQSDRALALFHQFGKDLAWIRSMATNLEASLTAAEDRRRASTICEISEQMTRAIRILLCSEPGSDGTLRVPQMTRLAVANIHAPDRDARIAVSLPDAVRDLSVDARVVDILTNLLSNAVEASPHSLVALAAAASGASVRVEVTDNGPGMEPRTLARCFERGFTTKASEGGTGTGLYASQRLARTIRAQLELNSAVGEGTTAVLTAPTCASR